MMGKKIKIVEHKNTKPLSLVNNGYLSFFFLGCGSAFSKKLYQNNCIIVKGNTCFFVDFGTRASSALFELGHTVESISNIIITHSHADHTGGVEEIALLNRYQYKKKPLLITPESYLPVLWNETLAGGCKFSEIKAHGEYLNINDFFTVHKLKKLNIKGLPAHRLCYQTKINGTDIVFFQTMHIPSDCNELHKHQKSFGLIIDKKILFSSDTKFEPAILNALDAAYDFDFIFQDCQFFTGGVHSSYDELKTLDDKIKSKMYLMHYPDNYSDYSPKKEGFCDFVKQWHFYNFV